MVDFLVNKNYMDAIKILFEEHEIITDATNIAKGLRKIIDKPELYEQHVLGLIAFFREYADKYHHHKEEDILFPEMIKANELLESGVIQEMFENHENFRELIAEIEQLTKDKNYLSAQNKLEQYADSLIDHIAVENEEVFEIAKTLFSDSELEKIYFRFKDLDNELGENNKNILQERLNRIQQNIIV